MNKVIHNSARPSLMLLNEVYFWTDTIQDWKHLLKQDKYKMIIVDILRDLVSKKQVAIYGFVIMPNHIHLLWELLSMNGKEKPNASFNKATGHLFIKDLKLNHPKVLEIFKVEEETRSFRIWQNDPLAIMMNSKSIFLQKLDYIHNNPMQEKWNLTKRPEEYFWSSASYYENGKDEFNLLTHFDDRFG